MTTTADPKDLKAFAADADAWFRENVVADPGFMLPLTFMEVGTDQQSPLPARLAEQGL
jgi:hypothetical protein